MDKKALIVSGFTEGRTEHSSEMTQQEAFEMIDHLVKLKPQVIEDDPDNRMRRKIISIAYEMKWAKPGQWATALLGIDNFCKGEHGIYKKELQEHTHDELVKVVSQFGQLYKKYLNGI